MDALAALTVPSAIADQRLSNLGCLDLDEARARTWLSGLVPSRLLGGWLAPPAAAPAIEAILRLLPTGGWRIHVEAARALAVLFGRCPPGPVLEFGSGSSTILFAALCAQAGDGRRVVSLDENEKYAARTRTLLATFGLGAFASVLVAPVDKRSLEDWTGWMYRPGMGELERALGGRPAGLVFVDGPATPFGRRGDARFGTLLLARPYAACGAIFAADDALRARDLAIVRRWRELRWLDSVGILPLGWGLAVGRFRQG